MNPRADRWERLLNPILVRVLRQDLRSRTFISVFQVMLVVVTGATVLLAAQPAIEGEERSLGWPLFVAVAISWSAAAWAVMPLIAFQAVARERNDDTWDLVELTGMRPRRLVQGLIQSASVQSLLYGCGLAPFLVLSYLLRGVDFGVLILALVLIPVGSVLACSFAVFVACLGTNRALRSTLGGLMGLGLVGVFMTSFSFWMLGAPEIVRGITDADADDRWIGLGLAANTAVAILLVQVVLAAALLTHRAQDRSSGPRLLWIGVWLNALGWTLLLANHFSDKNPDAFANLLGAFGLVGLVWTMLLGWFAFSEDAALTAGQQRVLTARGWRGWLMPLIGPGVARGRLCTLLLAALTLTAMWIALRLQSSAPYPDGMTRGIAWGGAAAWCYYAIIMVLADVIYRHACPQWFANPAMRRAFILMFMALVGLVPLMVLAMAGEGFSRGSALNYAAVPIGIGEAARVGAEKLAPPSTLVVIFILGGAASLWLLAAGLLGLRTRQRRVTARDDDHNPRGQ